MKLWLVTPKCGSNLWDPEWSKSFGCVVRSESEEDARHFANEVSGEETLAHPDVWLDPKLTDCYELTTDGNVGVVLHDFRSA